MKMKRVNFTITESNDYTLRKLSERTGLTKSDLVRRAIDAYLHKYLDKLNIRRALQSDEMEEE